MRVSRAAGCAGCWMLFLATCMAGLVGSGVKAFSPIPLGSTAAADAVALRRGIQGDLRDLTAARAQHSDSKRAATAQQLRDITMRLYSEPPRTAWTAPPAVTAPVTAAMPMIEKKGKVGGGAAVLERPAPLTQPGVAADKTSPEDKFKVMLFNDNGNTREYVARCLVQVVGMTEGDAYSIMTMAHKNGMALVGIWHLELAEGYCDQLKTRGLIAEIFPLGNDS